MGMARANGVREIWASGKAVINSWCGVPSSFSAEVMAHAGFDSLVVDMQHGMIETQEALDNLDEIMSVKGLDGVYAKKGDRDGL
jgi:4-hydroxy-2-oxoheptanedioate aldolase